MVIAGSSASMVPGASLVSFAFISSFDFKDSVCLGGAPSLVVPAGVPAQRIYRDGRQDCGGLVCH